jgi:hypothetical protein
LIIHHDPHTSTGTGIDIAPLALQVFVVGIVQSMAASDVGRFVFPALTLLLSGFVSVFAAVGREAALNVYRDRRALKLARLSNLPLAVLPTSVTTNDPMIANPTPPVPVLPVVAPTP